MNTKNNQRYRDTEQLIQKTLLSLAKNTDIRQVTIRAICEEAQINRSTFYAHYLDINDLVDRMGRDMITDIGRLFEESAQPLSVFLTEPFLVRMITYVKDHRDFFDIYLNQYGPIAAENFSLLWDDPGRSFIESFGVTDTSEQWYHFTFFKAGFIAVLSQWVRNGCREQPEFLARVILHQLLQNRPEGI